MAPSSEWPALCRAPHEPAPLVVERAVWGKAHAAATGYRWLAASKGFERGIAGALENELNVGSEDEPERMVLWRNLGDRCLAVLCCRSRAIDTTRREGFIEKQVLQWHRPAGMPAALGALLLLPKVSTLTDEIWWRQREALRADADAVLTIDAADHPAVQWTEEELATTIADGREQLLAEVASLEALESFYVALLAGDRPACLAGNRRPLSAAALATLLLPMRTDLADGVSLAGWVPSSRAALSELATRWDGVVVTPSMEVPARPPPVDSAKNDAWTMARSLGAPQFLLPTFFSVDTLAASPPRPVDPGTRPAATESATTARREPGHPHHDLSLDGPHDESPWLAELHRFAGAVERRWLAPDELRRRVDGELRLLHDRHAEAAGELIAGWIERLEAARPAYADEEQWAVKVDLLRSAALVLAPSPRTCDLVGVPAGDRVPAFLFALAIDRRYRDGLERLGNAALRAMLEQSLRCRRSPWTARVRKWLEAWCREPGRGEARRLVEAALRDHSTGSSTSSDAAAAL